MFSKIIILFILFTASCPVATSQDRALVKSVKVTRLELFERFNVVGQCKNDQSRSYYATISGKVDLLSAKQGETIDAGEIIIAIDKKIAEALKAKAEATFIAAESSFLRNKSLFEQKIISSESLEKSKVNLATARFLLVEAIKTYHDMIITAPFNGQIGVVKARIGDRVNIGDYLFSIVAESPKNVFIQLPEFLYSKVSNGTAAIITDSNGNKATAIVSTVSQYLSDKGTVDAKINIKDEHNLIDGSYVNVELIINKHSGIIIPEQSLLQNDQGNFVYQIDNNNVVKQVYVDLGTRMDSLIEIISDNLKEGDLIVLEGLTKVQDGSMIELMD